MSVGREVVLSIAGFDPSAGAGVLADIKTFEQCKVYGLAVCSAMTFQTDLEFVGVEWLSFDELQAQIKPLMRRFDIRALKIGLMSNLETIDRILSLCKGVPHRVWDPIMQASAGHHFHASFDRARLDHVLHSVTVVTPNQDELAKMLPGLSEEQAAHTINEQCALIVTGGHAGAEEVCDTVWEKGTPLRLCHKRLVGSRKHGSGCVFSAALTAELARNQDLVGACRAAQAYTHSFLTSSSTELGYHVT